MRMAGELWSGRSRAGPREIMWICAQSLSHVWLFATPWTVAHQALLAMEFSRQEYSSGLLFPTPGDLPEPEEGSPVLAGGLITTAPPGKPREVIGDVNFSFQRISNINKVSLWEMQFFFSLEFSSPSLFGSWSLSWNVCLRGGLPWSPSLNRIPHDMHSHNTLFFSF